MKKSLALFLLCIVLLPTGFTRSERQIADFPSTAEIIFTSFVQHTDAFPISQEIPPISLSGSSPKNYLQIYPADDDSIRQYGLLELDLKTNLHATNPYNPKDIDLAVSFTAPSGKQVSVGAFWYQGFDLQTRIPSGEPGWKVRFTPDEAGQWQAMAYAPALGLYSTPLNFIVKPSTSPGYVRINPKNPRYLAYDNGDFFFPIGVNMAWWSGDSDPIAQYNRWLEVFTANGGNTIRVWMASWSFGIEWKDSGLGNYDKRHYEAWLLDQLFNLADRYGVKIILVLLNHGAFSLEANSEWRDNPYNAAQGGPLNSPEQFVSDPLAKSYFQQRLDYIINRWGYSTSLLAWEWFNEVNLTPITDAALIPWLVEMTAFLNARDVNHHLTTSSFAMRNQSWIWWLPGLDLVQAHEYSSQDGKAEHDLADTALQDFLDLAESVPRKPILMGEFGYSADNYGDDIEKTGIHLHNGLWATAFSGYAGSGMYWWWDIYLDANNLWHQFKGLATFLDGEDLTGYRPFSLSLTRPAGAPGEAVGLGLRGENFLVWLRSHAYTVQASTAAGVDRSASGSYMPPLLMDFELIVSDISEGSYIVRWFDPQTAQWLVQQEVIAQNGKLVVPIPPFSEDLAAKIIRNP